MKTFRGIQITKYGKYSVRIQYKGKQIYIGTYDILDAAIEARLEAEKKYGFGPDGEKPSHAYKHLKKNQFKHGHISPRLIPDGQLKQDPYSGYLMIKQECWVRLHIEMWKMWNNADEVPDNMVVTFEDKNRFNFSKENLVAKSREQVMRENTMNRFPKELRDVIHLKGQITRRINDVKK